jgi:uridine kinase
MVSDALTRAGYRVALLNVDGWLNLPSVRFADERPARHFYHHALRLAEFERELLRPLKDTRGVDTTVDFAEERATTYRRHRYRFTDIDIVLAEGIYLFKRHLRPVFDCAVWIDCTFDTALKRAIARAQEGLSPEATVRAYRTIYFPAQKLHFALDAPREGADWIVRNDPDLDSVPDRPARHRQASC